MALHDIYYFTKFLWVRNLRVLSWVVLAQGLVGTCSQDGHGWHGAEGSTESWLLPMTVGQRQQAKVLLLLYKRGFCTERKPSRLRFPPAALVKDPRRAQHGRSSPRREVS